MRLLTLTTSGLNPKRIDVNLDNICHYREVENVGVAISFVNKETVLVSGSMEKLEGAITMIVAAITNRRVMKYKNIILSLVAITVAFPAMALDGWAQGKDAEGWIQGGYRYGAGDGFSHSFGPMLEGGWKFNDNWRIEGAVAYKDQELKKNENDLTAPEMEVSTQRIQGVYSNDFGTPVTFDFIAGMYHMKIEGTPAEWDDPSPFEPSIDLGNKPDPGTIIGIIGDAMGFNPVPESLKGKTAYVGAGVSYFPIPKLELTSAVYYGEMRVPMPLSKRMIFDTYLEAVILTAGARYNFTDHHSAGVNLAYQNGIGLETEYPLETPGDPKGQTDAMGIFKIDYRYTF